MKWERHHLKKSSFLERWSDGLERMLRMMGWVSGGEGERFRIPDLERVLVMEATSKSSEEEGNMGESMYYAP